MVVDFAHADQVQHAAAPFQGQLADHGLSSRRVFLSHAAEDTLLVLDLADRLNVVGYPTWSYERDSIPGPSYLSQILQALAQASAVIVLLSPAALASWQVDKEIVQAHEHGLPFIPLLHGVTHDAVRARRPEWVMMFGAAVAVPVCADDLASMLRRIVAGLRWLTPDGATTGLRGSDRPAGGAAPSTGLRGTAALPTPATPLLGREREVAAASALVRQEGVRLVTLTGPGGVGKTRLGLHVAAEVRDSFDAVAFVPLAPLTDAAQVPLAIAQALGLAEDGDRPVVERLQGALQGRAVLLVLDNVEQVLESAPLVATLLESCPQLTVLATSRVPLRVRGEHDVVVPPLALPDLTRLPDAAALTQYAAVALFVARAQEVKAGFVVTAATAPAIAAICVRLDGLPLALELAAARIKLLAPQALLARLERRLPLLTGGARDLPARQQTLRNAIAWSYDLLSPLEQRLFRRLAVFVGGFTLEAVAEVCDATDDLGLDVLDGLSSLLDNSLLWRADAGALDGDDLEPRFGLLETIREYAWDELVVHDEAEALSQQHSAYFLGLAEAAEPELLGAEQRTWLRRLAAEHNNLRAALGWAQQHHDVETGLRLSGALWWFWHLHGEFGEGRTWLQGFLAAQGPDGDPAGSPGARAKALTGAGALAWSQGDHGDAAMRAAESLALYRALGDRRGTAMALMILGNALSGRRNYAEAAALYAESLALFRELGDEAGIALALTTQGVVASSLGDLDRAQALYEEALALSRRRGACWHIGILLNNLGIIAVERGEVEQATTWLEESLVVRRALRDKFGVAFSLTNLGEVTRAQGQMGQALAAYKEALPLLQELGQVEGLAASLEGIAAIAVETGQALAGVRLAGVVSTLLRSLDTGEVPDEHTSLDQVMAEACRSLGESTCAAEWAAGLVLPVAQAIGDALAIQVA